MARYRHPLGDHLVGGDGHRQPRPDRLALYRLALYRLTLHWITLHRLVPRAGRLPRPQREIVAGILGEHVTAGAARAPVP